MQANVNADDKSAEARGIRLCRPKGKANVLISVHLIRPGQAKERVIEAEKAKRRIVRA